MMTSEEREFWRAVFIKVLPRLMERPLYDPSTKEALNSLGHIIHAARVFASEAVYQMREATHETKDTQFSQETREDSIGEQLREKIDKGEL